MQILSIHVIPLVMECHGNMDRAVNDAYLALFSMGAQLGGVTPYTGMS